MAQFLYPISDIPNAFDPRTEGWSLPAWSNIDEVIASDADYTDFAAVLDPNTNVNGIHVMGVTAGSAPSDSGAACVIHCRLQRLAAHIGAHTGETIVVWVNDGTNMGGFGAQSFTVATVPSDLPIDGSFHQFNKTVDLSGALGVQDWSTVRLYLELNSSASLNTETTAHVRCSWLNLETLSPPVNWWKLSLPTITGYLVSLAQPIDYVLPFDIFSGGVFYPSGTIFSWTATTQPTDKGWWMSNGDAYAGAAFVVDNADRPKAPRGYTEVTAFATGSTAWSGGFPGSVTGFANHMVYAPGGYTVGTDSPTLRIYDGLFDRPIATIPNTSANAVPKAVMTTLTANGVVYVATFDSGTSSADWVGRVFSLNVESGQMTPMGNPLTTGHMPYALCWHAGRLWCGTHRQSSAASGKVFYIRPGIDTDWTADYDLSTSSVANCASLCSFQGKLYMGTTGAAGTFAKVLVRDTAGAYTTSLTLSGGAATANNGVPALAEFGSKLYATYYNADTPVIASIRKYDGSSWSTAYSGSGTTLVPFVGLPTDLTTLLAIGGGVGTAAVLLKTADGTTWTDQSVFLSQGTPSSTGLPAFAVVVH